MCHLVSDKTKNIDNLFGKYLMNMMCVQTFQYMDYVLLEMNFIWLFVRYVEYW